MRLSWSSVLLVSLLILLVVLIAYAVATDSKWAKKDFLMAHYVETPWQIYQRSTGTFDEPARLALERVTAIPNPTPGEHALAATIITRNILDQEHRPARDAAGAPTPAAVEQARIRGALFAEARRHYAAALEGLGRRGPAPNPRRANVFDANAGAAAIDAAIAFAFDGHRILFANDPLVFGLGLGHGLGLGLGRGHGQGLLFGDPFEVDMDLADTGFRRREEVVRERRATATAVAAELGGARGAAVDTYVELAQQNTDDPQNTHDPGVLSCLKAIIDRLRADQAGQVLPSIDEVKAEISAAGDALSRATPEAPSRRHLISDAVAVIERARNGERVVSIDLSDGEALQRVWLRTKDPRNVLARPKMVQAIFDALCDCWETGALSGERHIVCVNGRVSRILSTLVLLDHDERNWVVERVEQFKNKVFAQSADVIRSLAEAAAASNDPGERAAGRSYLAKTAAEAAAIGDVPDAAAEALAARIRTAIGEMVDEFVRTLDRDLGVKNAIPEYLVNTVKEEAQAAV